jgi:hypothetical protein
MKRFAPLAFVVLVGGLGVWVYIWWHSPAETKQFTAKTTTEEVLGSELTLNDWNTQYFATRYPNDLRIITSNEVAHGLTSGQYLLGSTSLSRTDQLAVTVGNLGGLALEELPAIKLRLQKTDVYQPVDVSFAPEGSLVFTSEDSYETAVFWRQDSRYVAVVVSGSAARQANLWQQLEAVVTNWQWR